MTYSSDPKAEILADIKSTSSHLRACIQLAQTDLATAMKRINHGVSFRMTPVSEQTMSNMIAAVSRMNTLGEAAMMFGVTKSEIKEATKGYQDDEI